mmetsp:Transcript_8374/g.14447  ORF Transcript_8374/g.14447 Transcript_8374/m.14447 type:complete len:129 (+) Transcript_8374:326-712(+)
MGGFWRSSASLLKPVRTKIRPTDHLGKTALHMAAFQGHLDIVRFLVESGADRCLKTKCGSSALDLAYQRCQIQVLLFLAPFERLEAEPSPENQNKARKVGNSSSRCIEREKATQCLPSPGISWEYQPI